MAHLGMKPRTIAVGQKEQNGTVEAQNGAFKRFLKQALLGRGSSDFASEAAFDAWLEGRLHQENHLHWTAVARQWSEHGRYQYQ